MSRPPAELPERLLATDATDFERRVLEAALQKEPSPAASARMARALGVTAGAAGMATTQGISAAAKKVATEATAAKATAAAGAAAAWPWISVGLLGLVVAGTVVGVGAWRASPPDAAARSHSVTPFQPPVAAAGAASQPFADGLQPRPEPAAPSHRSRSATGPGDVRDEIALLDAAREALSEDSHRRALEILRRYDDKYPSGSLRPEATAIEIEALVKLGRGGEARKLATRFVAEHRGSLLARRVAELAGLAAPSISR